MNNKVGFILNAIALFIALTLGSILFQACGSEENEDEKEQVIKNPVEARNAFITMVNNHKNLDNELKRFIDCRDEITKLLTMTENQDVKRMLANKLAELETNIDDINNQIKKSHNSIFKFQLNNSQMDSSEVILMEVDSLSVDDIKDSLNYKVDTSLVTVDR